MKKLIALALALTLTLILAGCSGSTVETEPTAEPTTEPTTEPMTEPTEPMTEPTTTEDDDPLSGFYYTKTSDDRYCFLVRGSQEIKTVDYSTVFSSLNSMLGAPEEMFNFYLICPDDFEVAMVEEGIGMKFYLKTFIREKEVYLPLVTSDQEKRALDELAMILPSDSINGNLVKNEFAWGEKVRGAWAKASPGDAIAVYGDFCIVR